MPALQAKGARVRAFDPEGMHEAGRLLSDVAFAANAYEAAQGADAVVIVTEWDQFRALDLERLKALMKRPVMVDLRNVYQPADVRAQGLRLLQRRTELGAGEIRRTAARRLILSL